MQSKQKMQCSTKIGVYYPAFMRPTWQGPWLLSAL